MRIDQEPMASSELDDGESAGASRRVYLGIMRDLEEQRLVPGQRLVETELAVRFGVGRNAVREALQRLAARGIVDLSRHRSAAIRQLDARETLEVLDVAEALTCLLAASAARAFRPDVHGAALAGAMRELDSGAAGELVDFSRARRRFYRTLLEIGGNRELQRLFPAVSMHVIYSQYQSRRLLAIRLADYRRIHDAVATGDAKAAEQAAGNHVAHIRQIIQDMARTSAQGEKRTSPSASNRAL